MKRGYLTQQQHDHIKAALGAYAWPGGYPVYLVMRDGGALCPKCVEENLRLIMQHTKDGYQNDGWAAAGADINWEDNLLCCDNCGNMIDAAYD